MENKFEKYCTGCGLCQSLNKAELSIDNKGFSHPINYDSTFLMKVCPVSGLQSRRLSEKSIWGRSQSVYLGWAKDNAIREKASSGGVLTTLALYLLKENIVDGIIHVHRDEECAYKNKTVISTTPQEVLDGSGSRYSISHPLEIIGKLDQRKKYCLIAKPCDITVIRNYAEIVPAINDCIKICLSFFCMGLPSNDAQEKLLEKLECSNGCSSLTYRGNGWPGFATGIDLAGNTHQITYDDSWGKILGRDLMPYCRYCIDGIGEDADIACGDAWYVKDSKPDFDEHEGRNIIFARSELGAKLLQQARECGALSLKQCDDYESYLPVVQYSQYMRRATLSARIKALQVMRKPHPDYARAILNSYSKKVNYKNNLKVFLGMLRRIHQGKY